VDLLSVLRFGDVFQAPEKQQGLEGLDGGLIREVVEEAASQALDMRNEEGARLEDDLSARLHAMAEGLSIIEARAPRRLLAERERLREAIKELSQQDEVDEDRLAKEIAYLAEKWDINEELVRFQAHIDAFRKTLEDGGGEPVGKRLGLFGKKSKGSGSSWRT
jgi:uncharacterized protein (TIGR00255 family)